MSETKNEIYNNLSLALNNGEFFLCYQPIIDALTNKPLWFEALIRWDRPSIGIISPMSFIPVCEETRLIIPIGMWVLKSACSQLKTWHKLGFTKCGISVNVSPVQLQQHDFAEVVCNLLDDTDLSSSYLLLEIIESVQLEKDYNVIRNLTCLKKQGIKISIDDFGTGYNCLQYLQNFVFSSLKIDVSFIKNLENDVSKVIVDSIISLGHKLEAKIIAEGIETKAQYEYLKNKECDMLQGYYFSKPITAEEMLVFLNNNF